MSNKSLYHAAFPKLVAQLGNQTWFENFCQILESVVQAWNSQQCTPFWYTGGRHLQDISEQLLVFTNSAKSVFVAWISSFKILKVTLSIISLLPAHLKLFSMFTKSKGVIDFLENSLLTFERLKIKSVSLNLMIRDFLYHVDLVIHRKNEIH